MSVPRKPITLEPPTKVLTRQEPPLRTECSYPLLRELSIRATAKTELLKEILAADQGFTPRHWGINE